MFFTSSKKSIVFLETSLSKTQDLSISKLQNRFLTPFLLFILSSFPALLILHSTALVRWDFFLQKMTNFVNIWMRTLKPKERDILEPPWGGFPIEIKTKNLLLWYLHKIIITSNNKISYFGFDLNPPTCTYIISISTCKHLAFLIDFFYESKNYKKSHSDLTQTW